MEKELPAEDAANPKKTAPALSRRDLLYKMWSLRFQLHFGWIQYGDFKSQYDKLEEELSILEVENTPKTEIDNRIAKT